MAQSPPADPLARLVWINKEVERLHELRRVALFEARLHGNLDEAIQISGLSRKRVLAETRHENEARGRMVRWSSAG